MVELVVERKLMWCWCAGGEGGCGAILLQVALVPYSTKREFIMRAIKPVVMLRCWRRKHAPVSIFKYNELKHAPVRIFKYNELSISVCLMCLRVAFVSRMYVYVFEKESSEKKKPKWKEWEGFLTNQSNKKKNFKRRCIYFCKCI